MDERLLRLYNQELLHIREMGGEFARLYPKIAGRLGMDGFDCADPYVERLLEGFAFLAGRVQLQIESEFPRFTEHLLSTVCPQYLSPLPSMTVVRFEPDLKEGSLLEGPIVERGSRLRSGTGADERTPCIYTTAHNVQLWPIEIVEVEYQTRSLASLDLGNIEGVRAALRLRLRTIGDVPFAKLPLDKLTLHLTGGGATQHRLYEQLFTHATEVVLHDTARPPSWSERLPADSIRQVGYSPGEALLPPGRAAYEGYRLLREYFAFPERFMFVELSDMLRGVSRCQSNQLDITVLLSQADVELEGVVSKENFELFCTPAINLFKRRFDRIHISGERSEYQLIPDKTAPMDYEVYEVNEITGFGSRGQMQEQEFEPFYSARDASLRSGNRHYTVRRVPRVLSEKERTGRRRSIRYAGSEVYLSLVDSDNAPFSDELRQLGGEALCTNRDLPIHMPVGTGSSDFTLETGLPIKATRCVGTPTPPQPAFGVGETHWRLISHLMPNYMSLLDTEEGDAAASLREVLALYADTSRPEFAQQVDGIRHVDSEPVIRRISKTGPISFARGLEVSVTFDEHAYEGAGVFVLGAVLERFFALHVTINVFTETVIKSEQRGIIKRWPTRHGQRQNL